MELPPGEVQHEAVHISDDDSATVITAVATCSFVAFTAVILRLISRRLKHLPLQQDDYAAIVALGFVAGLAANVGVDLYVGLGKHIILSNYTTTFVRSITATQILYIIALIPAKLSLIFFYLRLSTSPPLSITLWLLGIWVVITSVAGGLIAIFYCAESSITRSQTHCRDYRIAVLAYCGQNALTNLVLLCWPIQFIWGLEKDCIRNVHLAIVFALGGFACAASMIRLVYLANASAIDATWSATAPTIWSVVELTMGLTAGCLATFIPFMSLIHRKRTTTTSSSSSIRLTTGRRRTRSFNSDTETAIATPLPSSCTRTRTVSFKEPQSRPSTSISTSKTWQWKSTKKKTGADSPGFTWRCSGQPSDLERWKALPPPPRPPPLTQSIVEVEEGNAEAEFGPHPLFRPVVYGKKG